MELTTADLTLTTLEMGGNSLYTTRVAHKDDTVGKLFGTKMQMETRSIIIDNQFGFRKDSFSHKAYFFWFRYVFSAWRMAFSCL